MQIVYNDQNLNGSLSTFFTCHEDYKGRGIGKALARERINRIKELGYDFTYFIQDEGHKVEGLYQEISNELGLGLRDLYRFSFLTKILNHEKFTNLMVTNTLEKILLPIVSHKKKEQKIEFEDGIENYIDSALAMINQEKKPNSIRMNFSKEELIPQLKSQLSNTLYYLNKNKEALINYYNINLIGTKFEDSSEKITVVDYADFKNLSILEKKGIIESFCSYEKKNGSSMILIPTIPRFELLPFYANLFVPSGRYHNIRGFDFKGLLPKKIEVDYLLFR